jgi:hypothetical protein
VVTHEEVMEAAMAVSIACSCLYVVLGAAGVAEVGVDE